MRTRLTRRYALEAAHRLPNAPEGHKCARLHGHSYGVHVTVEGSVGDDSGWVMDFHDIDDIFAPVLDQLDHRCLNDVPGLENPTAENIARWVWCRLQRDWPVGDDCPRLFEVRVDETPDASCTYGGE